MKSTVIPGSIILFIHARSIGKGTYPRIGSDKGLTLKTSALKLFNPPVNHTIHIMLVQRI